MTPTERFRSLFDAIGYTHAALARKLGMNEREVRRWYSGDYRAPDRVVDWMAQLASWLADNPPPEKVKELLK